MKIIIIILILIPLNLLQLCAEIIFDFNIAPDITINGIELNEATTCIDSNTDELISLLPQFWDYEKESSYWFPEFENLQPINDIVIQSEFSREFSNVMCIKGSLSTAYSMVKISPPIEISAVDKTQLTADGQLIPAPYTIGQGDKFLGYGMLFDVGAIDTISIRIRRMADPITIVLEFEDDNKIPIFLGINIDGEIGKWYTYSYTNYMYYIESNYLDFNISQLILTGFSIHSLVINDYLEQRDAEYNAMCDAGEIDDWDEFEYNNPVENKTSDFEIHISKITIENGELYDYY